MKIMGFKRKLRSSFSKITDPLTPKINRSQQEGEENPSTEEQWIIPPFFKDYLFNKNFDWDSVPYFSDSPYKACGEPNDLLTMDLDLKHIPRLGTCRGDFAPTTVVVFKSHTSVSKGWRSCCQRVLTHPPFMDILQKVCLVHTVLAFSNLDISKDNESLLSLLYHWNSTTHTFFIGCQEVSPSLEDVYEILRLPLFGDEEVANISLSLDKAKAMKFLKDAVKNAVKKTPKKPILKAARKGKSSNDEMPKDISLVLTKVPEPTFGDGLDIFGENMLMA